jgi:hypothetical protein
LSLPTRCQGEKQKWGFLSAITSELAKTCWTHSTKAIGEGLAKNSTLTTLNLGNNMIGVEGGKAIAELLKRDHYLSLTLHWIDEEGNLHSAVSAAAHLKERANAEALERTLTNALGVFDLRPKDVHVLASDRGSNIVVGKRLKHSQRRR